LQQNGSNHEQADDDMNDDQQCVHVESLSRGRFGSDSDFGECSKRDRI
jgi:hypothetical protein